MSKHSTDMVKLEQVIETTLQGLDYELVGIEERGERGGSVLSIYMDKVGGVTIADCVRANQQLLRVLAVEFSGPGFDYRLEVSSPGLERPLFKLSDYARFAGKMANLRFKELIDGHRKLSGKLVGVQDECILLEAEGMQWSIPITQIKKANLIPDR